MRVIRIIGPVIAVLIAGMSYGQERGKAGYTNAEILALCEVRAERGLPIASPDQFFSARNVAFGIPHSSGLWVDGEFPEIPVESAEEVLVQEPKKVSLNFKVAKWFNEHVPGVIKIELNSDMLIFPGGAVSRYAKRQQVIEDQVEELQPIWESLEILKAEYNGGTIDQPTFGLEQNRLQALLLEKSRDHVRVASRSLTVIDGETVYDYDGAITENERYLVRVHPVVGKQGAYFLREVLGLDTTIYWGERRTDILNALETSDEAWPPTPFGDYNPNSYEDCQYLRETVLPTVEPGTAEVARELLDRYDLVAYGEFLDIPHATSEELSGLPNKKIEVGFRILELIKGDTVEVVQISLNSDMLFADREHGSRYAKRQDILAEENAYLRPFRERFEEIKRLASLGKLDEQDTLEGYNSLGEIVVQAWNESDLQSRRTVFSLTGESFYDRGGVIYPYQGYLLGLNRVPNSESVYLLGELPESPSRIYWGGESEDVLVELREIAD